MTIDERFERIEHDMAGWAEERRKDREENRQLRRDTQRQVSELSMRIIQLGDELWHRIEQLAEESRAADRRLEEQIGRLVEEASTATRAAFQSSPTPNPQ